MYDVYMLHFQAEIFRHLRDQAASGDLQKVQPAAKPGLFVNPLINSTLFTGYTVYFINCQL